MMAQLLGRAYTAIKDIKTTRATCPPCDFLILVPVQCIIEKQINSERIDAAGIFESSRTTSVAFGIFPGPVEEEYKFLKLPIAQGKEAGGNTYFVIWTSKMKEQCSGLIRGSLCHFGRGFLSDKSLCFVIRGGEPPDGRSTDQPHGFLLLLFASPHSTLWAVPQIQNAAAVMVSAELLACMRFLRPITCLQQGSVLKEDSHNLQKLIGREDGETWSSLPVILLWMIKDRLDFFDNVEVALVCHHWRDASINYPTKMQTVGDGIPWIMQAASAGGNKCVREFINIERRKKFAIELPEFYNSSLCFSKQGWILMSRTNVVSSEWQRLVHSLFLINPLTKVKIDLPDVVINYESDHPSYKACFSTSHEGVPNCVVLYRRDFHCHRKIIFYITYPGCDQVWTEHSCIFKMKGICVDSLLVINGYVYCCGGFGQMIIYDMAGQTTKEIKAPSFARSSMQVMERQGHAGLFGYCPFGDGPGGTGGYFYKYTHNSWQQLASDDDDANNLSMFESAGHSNLLWVRRQRGLNKYWIARNYKNYRPWILTEGAEDAADLKVDVAIHDLLLERGYQYVDLPYTIHDTFHAGYANWVDIG